MTLISITLTGREWSQIMGFLEFIPETQNNPNSDVAKLAITLSNKIQDRVTEAYR